MKARRIGRLGSYVLLAALLAPQMAWADAAHQEAVSVGASDPRIEQAALRLNEEGAELYAAGEVRLALAKFASAYALQAEPNVLFNMATCYELLGSPERAIASYNAFLEDPHADPQGRPRAEGAVRRLQAEHAPEQPAPASPQPTSHWINSPLAPWVALGVGTIFLGAGAALYLDGSEDHSRVERSPTPDPGKPAAGLTESEAQRLVHSGSAKQVVGGVTMGLGGVLLVGFAALIVKSNWTAAGDSPRASATFDRNAASLTWQGTF